MKNFILYATGIAIIVIPFLVTLIIAFNLILKRKKNKSQKENKE